MQFLRAVESIVRQAAARPADPWPMLPDAIHLPRLRARFRAAAEHAPELAGQWSSAVQLDLAVWLAQHVFFLDLAADESQLERLLIATVDRVAGADGGSTTLSVVEQTELEPLWALVPVRVPKPWTDPLMYAEKIGLTERGQLQPRGRLLLSLPDKEALQWLLVLEMTDAVTQDDPWRLSKTAGMYLRDTPHEWSYSGEDDDDEHPPFHWAVMERLEQFGLVELFEEPQWGRYGFRPIPEGWGLLRATLAEDNRMWSLARSLSRSGLDPDAPESLQKASAKAGAQIARMVVHELRNALFPAEAALQRVGRSVAASAVESSTTPHMERIDVSLQRARRFVDWLAETGARLDAPPERFLLRSSLLEARRIADEGRIEVDLDMDDGVTGLGYRDRFVLAVVNLLNNANQHAQARVRLHAETRDERTYIHVDDDGPGIQPGLESQVFVQGYSNRTGGQGQGLALARYVIENEHFGRIGVSRSPLGGARFSIALPL